MLPTDLTSAFEPRTGLRRGSPTPTVIPIARAWSHREFNVAQHFIAHVNSADLALWSRGQLEAAAEYFERTLAALTVHGVPHSPLPSAGMRCALR
jgi:hypothetical protein